MAKKHKKAKKRPGLGSKIKSSILGHFKRGVKLLQSYKHHTLGLLNLFVSLYTLNEVLKLQEAMDNIASAVVSAAISSYVNTMVMFSAVSSELQSLIQLFGGDKS